MSETAKPDQHGIGCRRPWVWWRAVGSLWACPVCRRLWVIDAPMGYKHWTLFKEQV